MIDERKKVLAEEVLKGTSKTEIAKKIGVNRQTLYDWMKDPEWQSYFSKLVNEMDAARMQRLLPTILLTVELFEEAVRRQLRYMQSDDPEEQARAEKLGVIADCLRKVHELERIDSGRAPKSSEGNQKGAPQQPEGPRKPSRLELLLDNLLEESEPAHDPSETAVAKKKELN